MKPAILTITGPTASGKSNLAEALAQRFPIDIISVDSAMVYRGMDIGTAKPSCSVRLEIPHHLIDIRDPAETYSAAEFRQDAINAVSGVLSRGRIPCLTGGSMLYLKALKHGIAVLPSANSEVRRDISALALEHGWEHIHATLAAVDPEAAARISENDPQRLQRALEVFEVTGRTMSEHLKAGNQECPFELLELAILPERSLLHQRIEVRFREMLRQGLVDEVAGLLQRKEIHGSLPSMKSVGYRQVAAYLGGQYDYETMTEKSMTATRRLAKHQCTWLNSWQGLHRLSSPDIENVLEIRAVTCLLET